MILVTCEGCGKKLKVDEKRIGSSIKCPGCGTRFVVPAPGSKGAVKLRAPRDKTAAATVSINWLPIFWGALALIVVGAIAAIYLGPVSAKHQWDAIVNTAEETIGDVIQHGLAHEKDKEAIAFAPNGAPLIGTPSVIHVHSLWKGMVMSLPDYVEFTGVSSEGTFKGKYYTKTGEVVADAEMGARVIANIMAVNHGNKTVKITGRKKAGVMTVEVDGASIP